MAEGLTRRFVITSNDDRIMLNDGSGVLDDVESGGRRCCGVRNVDVDRLVSHALRPFMETTTLTDGRHHSLHVQPSISSSTPSTSLVPVGQSSQRRPSSPLVEASEAAVGTEPWQLDESLHNDNATLGENQRQLSEKNCERSMSVGQTGETSLETGDSAEHFNATPPSFRPQPPLHLLDYSLFKVDLLGIETVNHRSDLDIAFQTSFNASGSDDEGSDDDDDVDVDDASITRSFMKSTFEQNPSNQVRKSAGTRTGDVSANLIDDCNTNTVVNNNDDNGRNIKVHYFLRLPSAASLKQAQMAKVERAERTADFMETAKALSLTLSRNRWSRRRPHRSASSSPQVNTTNTAAAATIAPLAAQRSFHSCVPVDEGLKGTADSWRRAPPRRAVSYKINRPQSMLEMMAIPSTTHDNAKGMSNGWGGRYSPRKCQQGYVAPFPMPSPSRENSVESLHQLLEQEQAGYRRSPLRLSSKFRSSQQEQLHQQHQPKDSASMSASEAELARQRVLLGYEEMDVPLKAGDDVDDEGVDYGFNAGTWSGKSLNTKGSDVRKQRRRHSAFGTADQEPCEEVMVARTQRRHVQRRRSFVSGSKIEQFDEQIDHQGNNSSNVMNRHHGQEEPFGGGVSRIPFTKRSSLSSGSMSIESYNEWKNEMMAQNG